VDGKHSNYKISGGRLSLKSSFGGFVHVFGIMTDATAGYTHTHGIPGKEGGDQLRGTAGD